MHRIDGEGHVGNQFTEGVPNVTPATVVTADWCNAVQEELVFVIEEAGITLDKENNEQLLEAVLVHRDRAHSRFLHQFSAGSMALDTSDQALWPGGGHVDGAVAQPAAAAKVWGLADYYGADAQLTALKVEVYPVSDVNIDFAITIGGTPTAIAGTLSSGVAVASFTGSVAWAGGAGDLGVQLTRAAAGAVNSQVMAHVAGTVPVSPPP